MFKRASVVEEVVSEMEKLNLKAYTDVEDRRAFQKEQAINQLKEAALIFEHQGLKNESEGLKLFVESVSSNSSHKQLKLAGQIFKKADTDNIEIDEDDENWEDEE